MKRKLITAILMLLTTTLWAADNFVSFKKGTGMIPLTGSSDTIVYDKAEWKGVIMAINNLRQDLKAVTGSDKANIIVATVGKSPIAKKYEKYAKMLKGKWEQYIIIVPAPLQLPQGGGKAAHGILHTTSPLGGLGGAIILGSDKRGTIYGIYELSRQLGVSPWYWWADIPVAHHDEVYVKPGVYTDGEPKVKYRGIFINDENPCMQKWAKLKFGGMNSKM